LYIFKGVCSGGKVITIHPDVLSSFDIICLVVEPNPSEKYEFVSWDDDIPNIWENKIHVPNHQTVLA
jgi:hypothetical protein